MPVHKTMRITGGALVRRRFLVPPMVDEGSVRPTPDRVREAVFSMLQNDLPEALVLDLFAGSGAHGYEAISRGAKHVQFVEFDRRVAAIVRQNIEDLGLTHCCSVHVADATKWVHTEPSTRYNIVFLDPPYSLKLSTDFFTALRAHLSKDGVVIYRCFKKERPALDDGWSIERDRVYGGTRVFVIRPSLT